MRLRAGLWVVYAICAVLAVFWLPLHVAVRPSGSISYMMGFNNRVALVALAASLVVAALFARNSDPADTTADASGRVSRSTLLHTFAATTLLCAFMTWVASPTWSMDESTYLIGRVKLLLAGQRPYRDFEYIYGPLLLYLPAWIARIFHLGPGPAYFLAWWLEWLAGTAMLAWMVGEAGIPRQRVRITFLLLWSAFLSSLINTGETYTPLRELAAPASMLVLRRMLRSERSWRGFVLAVVCAAALFCLSPEFAIAFMVAATLYVALCGFGADRWWRTRWFGYAFACMLAGFGVLQWGAGRLHEFDSARQFGSGGSDIPLLLTPTTLLVMVALVVAVVEAAERVRASDLLDVRVPLVLMGFLLLPGMMGRADPSHLILYGMSMLMVTLLVLARRSARVWDAAAFCFLLFLTAPLLAQKALIDFLPFFDAGARVLYPQGAAEPGTVGERVALSVRRRWGARAEESLRREVMMAPPDPHTVYPQASPMLMAPFGYVVRGREKQVRPDVDLGYFDGTVDLMSPLQVRRKVDELRAHPQRDLLLPQDFANGGACMVNPGWAVGLLRLNFVYSYLTRPRHRPDLLEPLCSYIVTHYERLSGPSGAASLYEVWRPIRLQYETDGWPSVERR